MSNTVKQAIWSFITTFVVVFAAGIPTVAPDDWQQWALTTAGAAAVAAAKVALSALNPKVTSYGVGARNG